jgi:ornithine cyclodeaminase/alanine dehydrogenase-like protein (mu-crystallin family)
MALYLTEQDVTQLLTMDDALAAVEGVFKAYAAGTAANEPRRRVRAGGATLNVMSAAVANLAGFDGLLGLKAYTVSRNGYRFVFNLFDATSGDLLAFIEADKLGQMRTGAASGVATKYLAKQNAQTVGVYGAGWQASSQLAAVCAVRDIKQVKVYSRKPENRARFCEEMKTVLQLDDIVPVEQPEAAADTDVICTITSAREPVLQGAWLKPGAHVNAAGGNSVLRREFDDETATRATFICADSVEQAKYEAGELIVPVEKGLLMWERVHELRHVVNGALKGRHSADDITIFKSLGIAIEDVAAAAVVYRKAKEQQLGKEF